MVIRRGNLNQALKEHLVGIRSFQPHLFPMFVGVIKMRGIECVQALLEEVVFFVRFHESFVARGTTHGGMQAS